MAMLRKRLPSSSPRKAQVDITSFTSKRADNKSSPRRSYAQALSENPYKALSDPVDEDEIMEEIENSDSSDVTPKRGNAQVSESSENKNEEEYQPSQSKRTQCKLAKANKNSSKGQEVSQAELLSSATQATLENARKAKEMLQGNLTPSDTGVSTEGELDSGDTPSEGIVTQDTPQDEAARDQLDRANKANDMFQRNYTSSATDLSTEYEANPEKLVDPRVPTLSASQDGASVEKQASKNAHSGPVSIPGIDRTEANQRNVTSTSTSGASNNSNDANTSQCPLNPYQRSKHPTKENTQDTPQRTSSSNTSRAKSSIDKPIILKKGMLRNHIHCYTLRIKIISSKSEEEEQSHVQKTLHKFFDIVLQGDNKSIIPPYFELDRADTSVPDISSMFKMDALDLYYSLKRYFSRLSPRTEEGFVWCSIILAQSVSFNMFMEKTRHSLENQSFSLWPKASDHELAADIGWLLYSTREQEEERVAEMVSALTGEKIGAKWRAIHTTDGSNRSRDKNKDASPLIRVQAIHLYRMCG
jgi:hypothetical protein